MSTSTQFTAEILEASAPAYAGYAASLLLERQPELEARYAPAAMNHWKTYLTQRTLELAAALAARRPELFAARVQWARKAFQARQLADRDLLTGLGCLRQVLLEELPDPAHAGVVDYLDPALASFGDGGAAPVPELGLDAGTAHGRLALRYMQTALEGDSRDAVELVIAAAKNGSSTESLYLDVLLPAQLEVGELWHVGEVSVAEEHQVTATTERAMSILTQRAARRADVGKTVIAAAVAGNHHAIGVRAVADFFELAGWKSICLGADVPASEVANAAVFFEADLTVLSAALATQLKTVGQTVEALRALDDRVFKVLVGGVAFADAPDLWQRYGADGYAPCAASAVEIGARLVGLSSD